MKTSGRTILYVEDDPHHAALVLRALEGGVPDARVVHVEDGEAALRYVDEAKGDERPALVLLDLRLPKLDGLEVLATLKASREHRAIPVVILSTSDSERDIGGAYEKHANSYLVKPVDVSQLEGMLRDVERYWLGWNARVTHRA